MTGLIGDRITIAEEKWLFQVQPYTRNLFSETFIPSHDHRHHQRVWSNSKKLLIELDANNSRSDQDLVEGVLLAVWFHDTGMVTDPGIKHGALGKEIFESFIGHTPGRKTLLHREIMEAIEFHDSKKASAYPAFKPGTAPGILGILSVADDLDALGVVGIYRYIEIYLKREVALKELGIKILANVQKRFENIQVSCAALPGILEPYRQSYKKIESFFNFFNQQLETEKETQTVNHGHLGIVNHIRQFSLESEISPENFINQPEVLSGGDLVKNYFYELHRELEASDN